MDKKKLRKTMSHLRDELKHRFLKDKGIRENLYALDDFKNAKKVFVFYSVGSEVDTRKIIEDYIDTKEIYIPYIDKDRLMHAVRLRKGDKLVNGFYNIPTAADTTERSDDFDIILCPGLAFDKKGNRLGYGGGFYDRFMKNKKAKRIALAYGFQVIDHVPSQIFDEKVDRIVTEC